MGRINQEIKTYKQLVKEMLEAYPYTRNNDIALMQEVVHTKGYNIANISALDLLVLMKERKIPSWKSISRLRRMVVKENPHLKGQMEEQRKGEEKRVFKSLGYGRQIKSPHQISLFG